jgi:hypothetical protein
MAERHADERRRRRRRCNMAAAPWSSSHATSGIPAILAESRREIEACVAVDVRRWRNFFLQKLNKALLCLTSLDELQPEDHLDVGR